MSEYPSRQAAPKRAVIVACTKSKLARSARADELYTGVVWQTLRRALDGSLSMPWGWQLFALSAEHGLVRASTRLAPYDRAMTPKRAAALERAIRAQWSDVYDKNSGAQALVIGGDEYQRAAALACLPVVGRIDGCGGNGERGGVGTLRRRLRRWAELLHRARDAHPYASSAWPTVGDTAGVRVLLGVDEIQDPHSEADSRPGNGDHGEAKRARQRVDPAG